MGELLGLGVGVGHGHFRFGLGAFSRMRSGLVLSTPSFVLPG